MLSSVIDRKVYDWRWKKRPECEDTVFYIGDKVIGQLFYSPKRGWSAVHRLPSTTGGPVWGFRSRVQASEYLSQLERFFQEYYIDKVKK